MLWFVGGGVIVVERKENDNMYNNVEILKSQIHDWGNLASVKQRQNLSRNSFSKCNRAIMLIIVEEWT